MCFPWGQWFGENRCQGSRVIRRLLNGLLHGDRDHFCVLPHSRTQAWLSLTSNERSSGWRWKDLRTVAKVVTRGQTPALSELKGRDLQWLQLACCVLRHSWIRVTVHVLLGYASNVCNSKHQSSEHCLKHFWAKTVIKKKLGTISKDYSAGVRILECEIVFMRRGSNVKALQVGRKPAGLQAWGIQSCDFGVMLANGRQSEIHLRGCLLWEETFCCRINCLPISFLSSDNF